MLVVVLVWLDASSVKVDVAEVNVAVVPVLPPLEDVKFSVVVVLDADAYSRVLYVPVNDPSSGTFKTNMSV